MKKSLFLLFLFTLLTACNNENNKELNSIELNKNPYTLTSNGAKEVLNNFLNDYPITKGIDMEVDISNVFHYDIPDMQTDAISFAAERIPVYQFTTTDGKKQGYSLVIGDERIKKVLTFVEYGSLADTAFIPPLKWFVESIPAMIANDLTNYYNTDKKTTLAKEQEVSTKADFVQTLGPLLKTSWGQITPYNALCPTYCSADNSYTCDYITLCGGNCPAGCVAIAISQILAYHKKPSTMNWNSILANPSIENASSTIKNSVATLVKEIGTRTGTKYECNISWIAWNDTYSMTTSTLRSYGINLGTYYKGFSFNQIYQSIQNNRPVIIWGKGSGAHIWVCDGWKSHNYGSGSLYNYLHMNWGWGGNSNGFFYIYDSPEFITWGTFGGLNKYNFDFEILVDIR